MSEALLIALIAVAGTIISAASAFMAVWVDRRAKHRAAEAAGIAAQASDKAAEAAERAADAAAEEARAQMRKAVVAEREAASADWARYVDAQDRQILRLIEHADSNTQRITDAELRIEEADQRAHDWEKLYRKAVIYLRKLIAWIGATYPGEAFPAPPPELDLGLEGGL